MDPVSHLVFGRAIAAMAAPARSSGAAAVTGPGWPRGRTAAIVIGSIAPDADCVLMPTGWDRYLLWHERGTHALIGTALDGLALAGLMWLALRTLDRRRARKTGVTPQEPARFRPLWLAAWLGALGHITLDIVSGGTIRLFAPFTTTPFAWPLTAMADPLIALPLVAFLIASLVWKRHTRALAAAVFAVLIAILGLKLISERAAREVYRTQVEAGAASDEAPRPALRAVESRWGTFTGWMFYDRTADHLRGWSIDARTGAATLRLQRPRAPARPAPPAPATNGGEPPLIAASRELDTVRHLFTLFDLTFVETRPGPDGTTDVMWTDIRFCGPDTCALWFGGSFDANGQPREQFVLVGGLRQSRPL